MKGKLKIRKKKENDENCWLALYLGCRHLSNEVGIDFRVGRLFGNRSPTGQIQSEWAQMEQEQTEQFLAEIPVLERELITDALGIAVVDGLPSFLSGHRWHKKAVSL